MVRLQDEPIADPVCVPVYYVSKLARDHGVIVCQVGEGADELFCGYPTWQTTLRLQRLDDLPVPASVQAAPVSAAPRRAGTAAATSTRRCGAASLGQPVFWGGAEAFTEAQKRRSSRRGCGARFGGLTSWDALAPIRRRFEAERLGAVAAATG